MIQQMISAIGAIVAVAMCAFCFITFGHKTSRLLNVSLCLAGFGAFIQFVFNNLPYFWHGAVHVGMNHYFWGEVLTDFGLAGCLVAFVRYRLQRQDDSNLG